MKCAGVGSQTELEFMYSLWARGNACRGPLVSLRLRGHALEQITAALSHLDATDILDRASVGPDKYEMCAAHWYDVSLAVGAMAEAYSKPEWESFKTSIFIMTSKGAEWDYREMYNRFTSFYRAKLAGNR